MSMDIKWAKSFGDTGNDNGMSIATDSNGNVYVTGYFTGSITIGNTPQITSNSDDDVYVAKYNTNGVAQWAKSFGSAGNELGQSIATDSNGNVYVTGYFTQNITIGNTPQLNSAGDYDVYVAKYNTNGDAQWAKSFGNTGKDRGMSIATDSNGNVYVTGIFTGSITIGNTPQLTSNSGSGIFVAKYNTNGVAQWAKSFEGTSHEFAQSIATDSNGNVYVTGYFQGSITIGSTPQLNSKGSGDIYVAKYDTNGDAQWATSFGDTGFDLGQSIATDSNGNVYVTGRFQGSITIGNTPQLTSEGGSDIFVVKFSPPAPPPSLPADASCFPGNTPIQTNQGIVNICDLCPNKHTIRGNKIETVTQNTGIEDFLILIKKDTLYPNIPSQDTYITFDHIIFVNKQNVRAGVLEIRAQESGIPDLMNRICQVPYNGEILYNVLLKDEKHDYMCVNNLIVETMSPKNVFAKYYSYLKNKKQGEKNSELEESFKKYSARTHALVKKHNRSRISKM
jgi:hypothetical protein